jgi:ABC-2 type transport system permease protein
MKNRILNFFKNIAIFVILILFAYLLSLKFFRIDLSSDKKYSLSNLTVKNLENLDKSIKINVYLSGDLPLSFKRLEKRINETLEEFSIYSDKIDFEFIDPYEKFGSSKINDLYEDLSKLGIRPTNLKVQTKDGFTQKKIFPGATVKSGDRIVGINFLVNKQGFGQEQNLNASVEGLEYNILNAIKKITKTVYNKIAILQGHSELNKYQTADIFSSLYEFYDLKYVTLNGDPSALNPFDILIVAGAKDQFSYEDREVIDHFIMRGGKSLWFIDGIHVNLQELMRQPMSFGIATENNLLGMLFNYGARINYDLLMDRQSMKIPINIASKGESPNFVPAPWLFSPMISPVQNHPITKNLNFIKSEFISSIDTVNDNKRVKKTILLRSSDYTRSIKPPVKISMDWINKKFPLDFFINPNKNLAVLMEGEFKSNIVRGFTGEKYSKPTKMIVVSDASIIENGYKDLGNGKPQIFPLGFDRFANKVFANKEFVINCVNYLSSESELVKLRGRNFKLRLLDRAKIEDNKSLIVFVNVLFPILIILLLGFVIYFLRRRKYR